MRVLSGDHASDDASPEAPEPAYARLLPPRSTTFSPLAMKANRWLSGDQRKSSSSTSAPPDTSTAARTLGATSWVNKAPVALTHAMVVASGDHAVLGAENA